MNNIKFSIVIPIYNGEHFVERCLDSVLEQTFKNFEIVLINDGSKDNTDVVVKKYINNHPEVSFKYECHENGGAALARGYGVKIAEGDYIALLDADDIWYPNKLKTYLKYIEKYSAEVYYSDEYEVSIYGEKLARRYYQLGKEPVIELITGDNPISTSTVVVKADFLKTYNSFFDGSRYGEDIACWIALAKAGAQFVHIPKILGEYVRQEKSLTMNNEDYVLNTLNRLVSFCDVLSKCGYSNEEVKKIKRIQMSKKYYGMARFYHQNEKYKHAMLNYKACMKIKFDKKAFAGCILAAFRIKK